MTTTCVVCTAEPAGDTFMGARCWAELEQRLADVPWLIEELDTTLSRQDKVSGSVGFISGTAERPLPLNLAASDAALWMRDRMASWVRDLWETHAPRVDGEPVPIEVAFTAVGLSAWLLEHGTWIRLHPAADELWGEIVSDIRQALRAVNVAPDKVYLGMCSAVFEGEAGVPVECPEDLYGRRDRDTVRCRTCGTEHDVAARREVLARAIEDEWVPIGDLVGLLNGDGQRVTSSMIRNLKHRGRIRAMVKVLAPNGVEQIRSRAPGDEDRPDVFRVGEVLDVISTKWTRRTA